jgi:ABC-2 type transport system ATP-binding protein
VSSPGAAIRVRSLRKAYGEHEAVRGLDFDVMPGEVFGLLGPNGAGKTTTVEILEGYRERDAGDVEVLGADPWQAGSAHRERIGVVLQHSQLPPLLTVREVHSMFAGYYERPRDVGEVIELVGLAEKAESQVKTLSGGQKRRLDLGIALIGDPELVFLDEPTTGFDPAARRAAWKVIAGLRDLGKTVFLTTHYLDEAQALADRVAIIKAGVIVAEGPPASLVSGSAVSEITFVPPAGVALAELPGGPAMQLTGGLARLETELPTRVLAELCGWAAGRGIELEQLQVTRPTLEDVYLGLVESGAASAATAEAGAA